MGKKKKGGRGVAVNLFDNPAENNNMAPNEPARRSLYSYYDYRRYNASSGNSGGTSYGGTPNSTPHFHRPRKIVDPATIREVYILQNFQFVLRRDLFGLVETSHLNTSHPLSLPQGIKRIVESVRNTDLMAPWESVHSLAARGTFEDFQCPICLEHPTAARITECGHVYCLPCALQYIHIRKEEGKPRGCPICHTIMHVKALRPCILHPIQRPSVGQIVQFDLFYRERYSCLLRRYDDPFIESYCAQIEKIEEMERALLEEQRIETENLRQKELHGDSSSDSLKEYDEKNGARAVTGEDGEGAVADGNNSKKEHVGRSQPPSQKHSPPLPASIPPTIPERPTTLSGELDLPRYGDVTAVQCRYVVSTEEYEAQLRMLDATSVSEKLRELEQLPQPLSEEDKILEKYYIEALGEVTAEYGLTNSLLKASPPLAPRPDPMQAFNATKTNTKKYLDSYTNNKQSVPISVFEIYAESEGQPYFLHMTTMKMLRYDLELRKGKQLPKTIAAPIEEIVTLTQTEETKHIYKVFSSIPLHGVVKLCLLDLSKVVKQETLDHFAPILKKLKEERQVRKEKEDMSYRLHSEDASWREYVERYNCGSSDNFSESQTGGGMPHLMLPSVSSSYSDHGLPPNTLDTRQRATKRGENLLEGANIPEAEGENVLNATALQQVGGGENLERNLEHTPTSVPSRATTNSCWTTGSAAKLFRKSD